jgi:hypothetical protein
VSSSGCCVESGEAAATALRGPACHKKATRVGAFRARRVACGVSQGLNSALQCVALHHHRLPAAGQGSLTQPPARASLTAATPRSDTNSTSRPRVAHGLVRLVVLAVVCCLSVSERRVQTHCVSVCQALRVSSRGQQCTHARTPTHPRRWAGRPAAGSPPPAGSGRPCWGRWDRQTCSMCHAHTGQFSSRNWLCNHTFALPQTITHALCTSSCTLCRPPGGGGW